MIRHDCVQGSPAWHALRLGLPTASAFGRIVTPTGKPSASAEGYLHELLAERLLGYPISAESTDFMERGKALEEQAVAYFEMETGLDTEAVGFCTTDDGRAGCSPDRLVGSDAGLEVKCPAPATHVGYMLDGGIADRYRPQVQGSLWVTGLQRWHTLSFHPDLPPALAVMERDDDYITALSKAVTEFCSRLEEAHARLAAPTRPVEIAGATSGHEGPSYPNHGG